MRLVMLLAMFAIAFLLLGAAVVWSLADPPPALHAQEDPSSGGAASPERPPRYRDDPRPVSGALSGSDQEPLLGASGSADPGIGADFPGGLAAWAALSPEERAEWVRRRGAEARGGGAADGSSLSNTEGANLSGPGQPRPSDGGAQWEISGRVLDETGAVLPEISVWLQGTSVERRSDSAGRFQFLVNGPGSYGLIAHHSRHGIASVRVEAPSTEAEVRLITRAGLRVTVLDHQRRPVSGARITASNEHQDLISDEPTNAEGKLHFRGLDPGDWRVAASHPKYVAAREQRVALQLDRLAELVFVLEEDARVSGWVVDQAGAPIAGARVDTRPAVETLARSDERGRFELTGLVPGQRYSVLASHPEFSPEKEDIPTVSAPAQNVRLLLKRMQSFGGRVLGIDRKPLSSYRLNQREVSSADGRFSLPLPVVNGAVRIDVVAPGHRRQLFFRTPEPELGDLLMEASAFVAGTVVDGAGAPVGGAELHCEGCGTDGVSEANGAFRLPLPESANQVIVTARKGPLQGSGWASLQGMNALQVVVRPRTTLRGSIYSFAGAPAPGTTVEGWLLDAAQSVTLSAGPDGRYAMPLAQGRLRLTLPQEDRVTEATLIARVQGEEMILDLGGAPGTSTVFFQIKDQAGYALYLVKGALAKPPSAHATELLLGQVTNSVYFIDGPGARASIGGLAPGQYTLVYAGTRQLDPKPPMVKVIGVPAAGPVFVNP